jgi:hypothetical protein
VAVPAPGEVHVFWLELKLNVSHPFASGIYWRRYEGGAWQPAELLVPYSLLPPVDSADWDRSLLGDAFDVAVSEAGEVWLAWVEPLSLYESRLSVRRFAGSWGAPEALGTGAVQGVALAFDAAGTLHLLDWQSQGLSSPWGDLRHRAMAGDGSWTAPATLDGGGRACCVAAAAAPDGLEVVWERQEAGRSTAVWRRLAGGAWSGELDLGIPAGVEARSPTVEALPGGPVLVAWSSRAGHGTGLVARVVGEGSCVPSGVRHCLGGARFAVEVGWRSSQGERRAWTVPGASPASGNFWFTAADNWEVLVKVLDGCAFNGHYWVFAAGATGLPFTMRVIDTATGEELTYAGPTGPARTVTDTKAFRCSPGAKAMAPSRRNRRIQ